VPFACRIADDDGLDGEIFVFNELGTLVHTTCTPVVLFLFHLRSYLLSREPTLWRRAMAHADQNRVRGAYNAAVYLKHWARMLQ
jgi:hypothetical protein